MAIIVPFLSAVFTGGFLCLYSFMTRSWNLAVMTGQYLLDQTLTSKRKNKCQKKTQNHTIISPYTYFHEFYFFLVGDPGSGKRSLIQRFCEKTFEANPGHPRMSGVHSVMTTSQLDERPAIFLLYHPGTRQLSLQNILSRADFRYNPPNGFVVTCDVTNPDCLDRIGIWVENIKSQYTNPSIIILGTKCDLKTERAVDFHTAQEFCMDRDLLYIETSAKTGNNVETAIVQLAAVVKTKQQLPDTRCANKSWYFTSERVTRHGSLRLLQI